MKELAAFMVTASAEERANLFRMLLPAIRHRMIIGIIGSLRGRLNDNRKQLRVISLPSGVVHGTVPIAVLLDYVVRQFRRSLVLRPWFFSAGSLGDRR